MSRSVKQDYPPKRVITLPDEKIVYRVGEGFVIEEHEEES